MALAGVLVALVVTAGLYATRAPGPPPGEGPKLVVIGIDGLDKAHLDLLIEAGRVPNLARLASRGTLAQMTPVEPVVSPVIWTSMASGKLPAKHGVYGWTVDVGGQPRVVDARTVRVRRFWEILDERGVSTTTVSWLVSYPPQPTTTGLVVSDRFTRGDWVGASDDPVNALGGRDTVERTYGVAPATATEWALALSPTRADAEAAPFREAALAVAADHFPWARDENTVRIAEAALDRGDPDVLALYLKGVDEVSHLFLQFQDERFRQLLQERPTEYARHRSHGGLAIPWEGTPMTAEHLALATNLVNDYITHTDGLIGRVLAAAGGDPDVVILSDHGFFLRTNPEAIPAPDHSPRATLLLSGPSFARDATIDAPSVLDVTPTLLHVLGHPVARDMDGRVLTEALADHRPVVTVDTFDATPVVRPEIGNAVTPSERLEEERLRALGYIK